MTDAGEHRGALFDIALDPALHLDEGIAGAADFARPLRAEIRFPAHAESLGRVHQLHDGLDLVAQEGHRDDDQHEGGAEHPKQEDIGVRGIGGAAIGDDAQDRVVEQDADFDEVRAADRVEPEGLVNLTADLLRQRAVDDREERLRQGRRQRAFRDELDIDVHALLGDARQCLVVFVLRIGIMDIDDRGDVLNQSRRKLMRDELPVPFEKDIGHDGLQNHHRQDDDKQGAGIKPLRHDRLQLLHEAAPESERLAQIGRQRWAGRCSHHQRSMRSR